MIGAIAASRRRTGGAQPDPSVNLTLFQLDPSAPATMWQDAAGTVAAAANSRVQRMVDAVGGLAGTAAAGAGPYLRQSGGKSWLEGTGSEYLDFGDVLDLAARSYFIVAAVRFAGPNAGVIAKSLAGVAPRRWGMLKESGNITSLHADASGAGRDKASGDPGGDLIVSAIVKRGVASNRMRLGGAIQGSDTVFTPDGDSWNSGHSLFLGYPNSTGTAPLPGYCVNGRIYGVRIGLADAIGMDDVAAAEAWAAARLP